MTSRKIVYVGWMLVYLISLPIWNFVLPTYAYWHFDDFSWGDTRKVAGGDKGNHGDKEGEFNSRLVTMKKWSEYEKERRIKEALERHMPVPRFANDRKGLEVYQGPLLKRSSERSTGSDDSKIPLTEHDVVNPVSNRVKEDPIPLNVLDHQDSH
ncbi:Putative Chitin synthase [Rhizopus microsporus]|nr:Putative Chitin synthase [Rhizopus microsporus]